MNEEYELAGCWQGYRVYVCYAEEGPNWEEALALYQEARNSVLFQHLAAMEKGDREE